MPLQNTFLMSLILVTHLGDQGNLKYGVEGSNATRYNEVYNLPDIKTSQQDSTLGRFSTPEKCARDCKPGAKPLVCRYKFTLEHYMTMSGACEMCKPNSTNQLANIPQCQCIEADGFERGMLSINRMLPGPSIQVCQNDTVVVDVQNNIEGMEVALHWHGIWQQGSQYYDGVPFLTQCPIPSGTTFRYQFIASNPGTHFYHSHAGLQKIDGQYGSLIVRQPRTVDPHSKLYDQDLPLHVIVLSDWMHEMSNARFPGRIRNNQGQRAENILINGKGRWKDPTTNQVTSVQLETFVVQPGKKYRFRMINSFSSSCPAEFAIEGHSLMLIAQDGNSVSETNVDTIISSSGERGDFILNANQSVGAYWIQVRALGTCNSFDTRQFAILRYAGGPPIPKNPQPNQQNELKPGTVYNHPNATCDKPQSSNTVCANQLKSQESIPQELLTQRDVHQIILPFRFFPYNSNQGPFKPGSYPRFLVTPNMAHVNSMVDNISFAFPRVPPLSQDINPSDTCQRESLPKNCETVCQCPHTHHIKKGAIVEVVLYNEVPLPALAHPFHLHGYRFYIFKIGHFKGSGRNIQDAIQEHKAMMNKAEYLQPAPKDTVAVPHDGYVIFRFKADNPGWWYFHCHFLYHTATGMNVVFHVGEKKDLPPVPPKFPTCGSYIPEIM